jgi:hypothetical protein
VTNFNHPYLTGRLELKRTEDGGRRGPIISGYRCPCFIGNTEGGVAVKNDAAFILPEANSLWPGSAAIVRVLPSVPESWLHLDAGSLIRLYEAERIIGTVTVIQPL